MMKSPSRLQADSEPLFLDTSVVINLVASGRIAEFASAIARPLCIEEQVMREMKRDPRDGADGVLLMRRLTGEGILRLCVMNDAQLERFVDLVGAPSPDDLGDGEAATLAVGLPGGCVAIDEKKARRIAARDHAEVKVYCSLDLICSHEVTEALGDRGVADCVAAALKLGRMRVLPQWREYLGALGL